MIDPITNPQWGAFIDRHPAASIFHSPGWLTALKSTYGYEPFVLTTSKGPTLQNGIVACRIKSWASRRLVSLPFSDHCQPLVSTANDLVDLLSRLSERAHAERCRSIELRPHACTQPIEAVLSAFDVTHGPEYWLHRLDLRPPLLRILQSMHPSSTQRAIRRGEREGLVYECGRTDALLAAFYRLFRMARRRHGVPPQPYAWFRNVLACMGDQVEIHVARKDGLPVAAMVTLSFKRAIYYKYGGSDAAHHRLGGMPFLFWQVIKKAHGEGFREFDLGRSDRDQAGLAAFKDHLGAARSTLTYYARPSVTRETAPEGPLTRFAHSVCAQLPDSALDLAGRLLYKHLG